MQRICAAGLLVMMIIPGMFSQEYPVTDFSEYDSGVNRLEKDGTLIKAFSWPGRYGISFRKRI